MAAAPRFDRSLPFTGLVLAGLLLLDATSLDVALARAMGGAEGFPLRDHWFLTQVLHTGGRRAAWVLFAGLALAVLWPVGPLRQLDRPSRVQLAVTTPLVSLSVSALKWLSLTSCPLGSEAFRRLVALRAALERNGRWGWGTLLSCGTRLGRLRLYRMLLCFPERRPPNSAHLVAGLAGERPLARGRPAVAGCALYESYPLDGVRSLVHRLCGRHRTAALEARVTTVVLRLVLAHSRRTRRTGAKRTPPYPVRTAGQDTFKGIDPATRSFLLGCVCRASALQASLALCFTGVRTLLVHLGGRFDLFQANRGRGRSSTQS